MTATTANSETPASPAPEKQAEPEKKSEFILYLEGSAYDDALQGLVDWVRYLLLPVYGREPTSSAPWCSRWWEHPEAVAQLHALWMSWQDLTGPGSALSGPLNWHRDCLAHVMASLRDPSGPFAGCKKGSHRAKEAPTADDYGF
ncbi:DUF4913 domain-containing protein [Streptomyces griseorubiginosus]|uniref:DUF4913 domain-containing protein n=1 Tax=Streptomyces griseorubiginosus TaxID=67304 RepID=UPI0011401234